MTGEGNSNYECSSNISSGFIYCFLIALFPGTRYLKKIYISSITIVGEEENEIAFGKQSSAKKTILSAESI